MVASLDGRVLVRAHATDADPGVAGRALADALRYAEEIA
jgi:hypothetical protein